MSLAGFFRKPLGLVLSGAGALGGWQAAALAELDRAGLAFDSVIGFSAGALAGAYYCLGAMEEAVAGWKAPERRVLRFRPKLFPPSLFSDQIVREAAVRAADENGLRSKVRCRLVVVSARRSRSKPVYAVYTPGGRDGWDGPLLDHLLASCAIPLVFPPVRLEYRGAAATLIDGGVPCTEPMSFSSLGPCKDVIVLDVVRPEESLRRPRGMFRRIDHNARQTMRRLIAEGLASLRAEPEPPRVFRLPPSKVLEFMMLDFAQHDLILESLALGASDAREFARDPMAFAELP